MFRRLVLFMLGIETYEDEYLKYKKLYYDVARDNRMLTAIMDTYKRDLEIMQQRLDAYEGNTIDPGLATNEYTITFDDLEELVVEDEDM